MKYAMVLLALVWFLNFMPDKQYECHTIFIDGQVMTCCTTGNITNCF